MELNDKVNVYPKHLALIWPLASTVDTTGLWYTTGVVQEHLQRLLVQKNKTD